jgi:RHS repeat-associated protein
MIAGRITAGHPVDVASGSVYATRRDISIAGRVELVWERSYFTPVAAESSSPLGPGWTGGYFATLTRVAGGFNLLAPEGGVEWFADPGDVVPRGGTVRNLGTFQELMKSGDRYVVTRWDIGTGHIARLIFPEGRDGDAWPLGRIEDVTGQGLDLIRDRAGRLTGVRQVHEGRTLVVTYVDSYRVGSLSLLPAAGPPQLLVRYRYDGAGRLCAAYDALGHADRYEYDDQSRLVREVLKDGGVFSFTYDGKGRCIRTSGLDRYDEKSLRYFEGIGWTEVTDSLGRVTRYQWNGNGQVVSEFDSVGAQRRTEFDRYGRVIARTDPCGGAVCYEYDERGNLSKTTDALGHDFTISYNENHLPLALTDAAGHTWRHGYDRSNRLIAVEDPVGGRWAITYDRHGNVVAVTDPTGACKRQVFGEDGMLRETTDWAGHRTRYTHDALGRVTKKIGPMGETYRFDRDALGRVIGLIRPDGSRLSFQYGPSGKITRFSDGLGRAIRYRYGTCGRLLEETDRSGAGVRYVWGTEPRRLESVVNQDGDSYTFEYDGAGRLIGETGFDGRKQGFEYDLCGRCIARVNGIGETIRFERDGAGRLIAMTLPDGTSAAFEYDVCGNLTSAVNGDGLVRFERDPLGRVVREVQGEDYVESHLNPAGHRIRMITSLGSQVDYSVDANGRVTRLMAEGEDGTLEFLRDARGAEIARRHPRGLGLEQDFDAMGRLTEQRLGSGHLGPVGDPVIAPAVASRRRAYGYDKNGSLTSLADSQGSEVHYDYDADERLLEVVPSAGTGERFTYDRTGNVVVARAAGVDEPRLYGRGNRLLREGRTSYSYDDNGRLIQKTEEYAGRLPRRWHYTWDALDQLRSVETPDGEVWTYGYDALGRRILKRGPTGEVRFVWDRDVIVHQIEEGRRPSTWVFEPGGHKPLCTVQDGRFYSVITDHLGTPRELVDSSGRVAWSANVTAWGMVAKGGDGAAECPVRFPGQWLDEESGLHYNRFRYYNAGTGTYISPDPIGLTTGLNVYAYARNPVNGSDPLGLAEAGCGDEKPVTEEDVRRAMEGAELKTQQGAVSLPAIQRYVDRLRAGETPPPIRVDDGIIVDGNHRYVAGRIVGIEPPIQPWTGGSPNRVVPWPDVTVSPVDWGNR